MFIKNKLYYAKLIKSPGTLAGARTAFANLCNPKWYNRELVAHYLAKKGLLLLSIVAENKENYVIQDQCHNH